MHSQRRTAGTTALLILACGLAAIRPEKACEAAPSRPRRHLSFKPARDKEFSFYFACKDARNCYKLTYNPRASRLELTRIVNDVPTNLGAADRVAKFATVGVWLRPREIRVELDGRTALVSTDTTFRSGGHDLQPRGVSAARVSESAPGRISFEENFEDHRAARERWKTIQGSWEIHSPIDELVQRNNGPPMFSAYRSVGEGTCLATTGGEHWADLQLCATLRIESGKKAGVVFNVHDDRNFAAFVIMPGENGNGKAQLIDFVNGEPRELAVLEDVDIERGQWYGLKVETYANQAWCSILGLQGGSWQTAFSGYPRSPATGTGRVGLMASGGQTLFDNVSARTFQSFADTLAAPNPGAWKLDDTWEHKDNTLAGSGFARLAHRPDGPRRIDVELVPGKNAIGAIFTHSPNAKSYYAFGLFNDEWQFRRVINSTASVLAKAPKHAGERYRLTLIDRWGVFHFFVDDRPVFDVADLGLPDLGVGLMGKGAAFANFRVAEEPEHGGVEIFATDFEAPKGADRLGSAEGFVVPDILKPSGPTWRYEKQGGKTVLITDEPGTLLLHAPVPGDVSITATVLRTGSPMVVAASDGEDRGYWFGLGENGASAVLHRKKGPRLRRAITGESKKLTLKLVKLGSAVLTYADSKPIFPFPDPAPLTGGYIGIASEGEASFLSLRIWAESASAYTFEAASPLWWESGGRWVLRAGLPDPALGHWITGIADKGEGYLWERLVRRGGFVWYTTVAPATEGYADGGSKTFPLENVHLTFCGRHGVPGSGYRLVLRPEGKSSIALYKGKKAVARKDVRLPKEQPVRVRVAKQGARIEIGLNGARMLVFEDPEPLDAGHLGLGVRNSRARFLDLLVLPTN